MYVRNTVLQDMQITVDIDLQEQKAHYLLATLLLKYCKLKHSSWDCIVRTF